MKKPSRHVGRREGLFGTERDQSALLASPGLTVPASRSAW